MVAPRAHVFRPLVKGNEALGTRLNTTLSYENVNKSTPYLFRVICVSAGFGRCSVAVTIVLAQNEIQTICIENRSV